MWRIPLSDLIYDEAEEQAVLEVLRSRWLTMGPKTEEFEAAAAAYLGVKYAVAVANCTCALQLAYDMFLAGKGVLVPDITFAATANAAFTREGGFPILTDIRSPDVALLSADAVKRLIGEQLPSRPIAVCTMHYAGFDADSEALRETCDSNNMILIEDAAHAIGGTTASGRKLGSIGHAGCFSFFSNKNMATGEGGLLVTNDETVARNARLMRSHGMSSLTYERHQTRVHGYEIEKAGGYNFRCTEITAALAIEQLKKLDAGNLQRRNLYRLYRERLAKSERVHVMLGSEDDAINRSACHILPLLCDTSELRDNIRQGLDAASIQTSHHYRPLHEFIGFQGITKTSACSNAESFSARELTLPLHPNLDGKAVEEICDIILKSAEQW